MKTNVKSEELFDVIFKFSVIACLFLAGSCLTYFENHF